MEQLLKKPEKHLVGMLSKTNRIKEKLRMKKKLLSVLAILLLVITFVAGCGKQSETPAMSEQGIPTIDQIKLGEDYKKQLDDNE